MELTGSKTDDLVPPGDGAKRMDLSVSGGPEGSELGGGEGENRKQKTQGGPGPRTPRRVRVEVRKPTNEEKSKKSASKGSCVAP